MQVRVLSSTFVCVLSHLYRQAPRSIGAWSETFHLNHFLIMAKARCNSASWYCRVFVTFTRQTIPFLRNLCVILVLRIVWFPRVLLTCSGFLPVVWNEKFNWPFVSPGGTAEGVWITTIAPPFRVQTVEFCEVRPLAGWLAEFQNGVDS